MAKIYEISDNDLLTKIFEGDFANLTPISSKIVRIFTSSTFTDTATERNSLMENVYPKLKEYCREKHGLEFQVVDMRWGVRDEATDDHKTTELCMQEIDNCQRLSLGPNFVVFLGQKYGYRPLPTKILENEFKLILKALETETANVELLLTWYKLDTNSLPPVYVLMPVSSVFKNFTNKNERQLMEEDQNAWWKTMGQLCTVLRSGAARLLKSKIFTLEDNHRYNWSVTEQEVVRGILEAKNNTEHTLGFLREIKNINVKMLQYSAKFIDINFNKRQVDDEAQQMLSQLRDVKVPEKLDSNSIVRYSIDWSDNEGINREEHGRYIDEFSHTFYIRIVDLVEKALAKQRILPHNKVYAEVLQHLHFCLSTTKLFQGRSEILEQIKSYILDEEKNQPFVISGSPGSGKTSILAKTAILSKEWVHALSRPVLLLRFLGTTPDSSSIFPLLKSVCCQLSYLYGVSFSAIPDDLSQLINHFKALLSHASAERPLFIFFDSLDQLSPMNSAHALSWLPISLPKHVKCIVSTLPNLYGISDILEIMIEIPENFVQVQPLGENLSIGILNRLLRNISRCISPEQLPIVQDALNKCNTPLYVKLVFDQISLWKSYTQDVYLAPSIAECISKLFERIENQHGRTLVSHALAYITASKNGLSEAELEDLISLDETVLNDIYQYHLPPIRRIPPLLWTRIRNDLPNYLSEREAEGVSVVSWYHRQFIEVSMKRFLDDPEFKKYVHSQLADYFMGVWANVAKPYSYTEEQKRMFMLKTLNGEADRKVPAQPEIFSNPTDNSVRYNGRKLSELPFHLIRSKRIKELYSKVLFHYKFLFAKLSCMPLNSVLADFEDYLSNYKHNKEVALVCDALRLSSSILTQNPSNLSIQIIGRLFPYMFKDSRKYSNVKNLIQQCETEGLNYCALVPAFNCFHVPGGPLVYSLEGHPFAVYGIYLLSNAMQLISVSNRFIVYDLSSGDIVKVVIPQIEGILQTLSVSPDRKYCVSYSNNDQIVIWATISNDTKTLNKQKTYHNVTVSYTVASTQARSHQKPVKAVRNKTEKTEKIEKVEKVEIKESFVGVFSGNSYFVAWSKYHFYLYNIKGKLIATQKVQFPLIQIEILSNDSINCCGVELEVVIRTEDCKDEEDKERDYMLLEYRCILDVEKIKNQPNCMDHESLKHYIPHSNKIQLHNALVLNKSKNKLYTCIEISDNFVECFRNKPEINKKLKSKNKIWHYHDTLDENKDRIFSLVLSDNEAYMLAVVVWGFKVFYLRTGQSKPLKLPTNTKNIQIGYKKLHFSAVFSKDNQYVVAGVRDKIFMFDTSYGVLIKTLDAHYGRITSVLGSSNDQKDLILSSSMDKSIKVWNLQNIMEQEFQFERLDKPVELLYVSSIACCALAQTRTQLVLISLKDGQIKKNLCHNPHGAIFNYSALASSGTFVVSSESNKIVLWDLDEMKVTFVSEPIPSHIQVKQLTFHNSDINFLCSSIDTNTKTVSIVSYAIPDGEALYKIEFGLKNVADYKNFVITTDEMHIVAFRNDKKIDSLSVFKSEDGSLVHSVKLQYANYINMFFLVPMVAHPHYVAVIDAEKGNIMNIKEKKFIRSIQKWNGKFTKDDKFGFYAPNRGGLELLDLKHGEKVKILIPKIAEGVFEIDVAITEDDKHVIYYHAGRRTMRAFRLIDGKQIADFKCTAKVKCMKTAQDSKSVVIGCEDGTLNMLIIADPFYEDCVSYLEDWRSEQVKMFTKTAEINDEENLENTSN